MLEFASETGSDDWWLMRLGTQLGENLPRLGKLKRYRNGDALVPEQAWEGTKQGYVEFMKRQRLHVVETIRDARTNRQRAVAFRTAAAGDELGDALAWQMWMRSNMVVRSRDFLNDVADYGSGFLTVTGSTAPGTGRFAGQFAEPLIVSSDGFTSATEQNALLPHLTEAGIQVGYDAVAQMEQITLFRPGYIRTAVRRTAVPTLPNDGTPWHPGSGWTWTSDRVYLNYTPDCTMVRLDGPDGMGVWEKHLDSVDRVNEITLNAVTLIVMQAYRQRAVSGDLPEVYPAEHPLAGQAVDYDQLFKSGPAALWLLPEGAKMWESAVTDVTPIYNARKDELKNLLSVTHTPQYVLSSDSANQSALGTAATREMLVFAVESMNDRAGATFAQALGLGFQAKRDAVRADFSQIETVWGDVTRASASEMGAAAKDAKQGGATQRYVDERIFRMTPAEMNQARIDRTTESFELALSGATGGNAGTD